jgi:hypothetical protein
MNNTEVKGLHVQVTAEQRLFLNTLPYGKRRTLISILLDQFMATCKLNGLEPVLNALENEEVGFGYSGHHLGVIRDLCGALQQRLEDLDLKPEEDEILYTGRAACNGYKEAK